MTKRDKIILGALAVGFVPLTIYGVADAMNGHAFVQEREYFCEYEYNDAVKKGKAFSGHECYHRFTEMVCVANKIGLKGPYPFHSPSNCDRELASQ